MQQGYGAHYTKVSIINNNVLKKSINQEGLIKIKREINFINFILKNKINFPIPKIVEIKDNSFLMEYLNGYNTLESVLRNKTQNLKKIIKLIKKYLNILHLSKHKYVSKQVYRTLLLQETIYKIKKRTDKIKNIISKYNYIKKVNGKIILNFDLILEKIKELIEKHIDNILDYKLYPIHGDTHLNNILINDNNEIKFIDARGYFGDSIIFGIKEYDYAKFYFGLGGYSEFDLKQVNSLNIKNDNITININPLINETISSYIKLLIITIWLGNAHCFIHNEYKVVESYFYAIYLASRYFT